MSSVQGPGNESGIAWHDAWHDSLNRSLEHSLARLAKAPLPVIAGGTDFYPALQDAAPPADIIDITRIDELHGIRLDDSSPENTHWRIGAASTWSDVLNHPLPRAFDALKAAARDVGSVQIQNRATLVGNLCEPSPAADGVPTLLALNASVELQRTCGVRCVPLSEFITGVRTTVRAPDELVTAIRIPAPSQTERSEFAKLGSRRYLVISIAMLAVHVDMDEQGAITRCALAVGSCSPVACRLRALEASVQALSVTSEDAIQRVRALIQAYPFDELAPIDDVRGSAAYRVSVVRSVLQRTLESVLRQSCGQHANQHFDPDKTDNANGSSAPL